MTAIVATGGPATTGQRRGHDRDDVHLLTTNDRSFAAVVQPVRPLHRTNRSRSIPVDRVRATHGSDRWTVETVGYGRAMHTAPALRSAPGPLTAREAHR